MMDNDNNKISGPSLGSARSLFDEFRSNHLCGDLFGGLSAAIIALPMALACGVA
jgi:MFS superfamily sulfate permease-like transporter